MTESGARSVLVLSMSVLALSCAPSGHQLVVQVVSDLTPIVDFDEIRVEAPSGSTSESVRARAGAGYGRGVRALVREGLEEGTVLVRATFLLEGSPVITAERRTRIAGPTTVITVRMTRDCVGVTCTDALASACLGGRCVPDECTPETPDACPPGECGPRAGGATCAAPAAACAESSCSPEGLCVDDPHDEVCDPIEVCDTTLGCRAGGTFTRLRPSDTLDEENFPFVLDLDGTSLAACFFNGPSAYVFDVADGSVSRLSHPASRRLGFTLAIDGDRLAVQEQQTGPPVAVFERTGSTWAYAADVVPSDADTFDCALALRGDLMVLGCPHHAHGSSPSGSGAAYVFERSAGTWTELGEVLPETAETVENGGFGTAVAIFVPPSGSPEVYVGAARGTSAGGYVEVFDVAADLARGARLRPELRPEGSDGFGAAIDVSDGLLVVGAFRDGYVGLLLAGAAYVFTRATAADAWAQVARLESDVRAGAAYFGTDVDIEGMRFAVGQAWGGPVADTSGTVQLYELVQGEVVALGRIDSPSVGANRFGGNVALHWPSVYVSSQFEVTSGAVRTGELYRFELPP